MPFDWRTALRSLTVGICFTAALLVVLMLTVAWQWPTQLLVAALSGLLVSIVVFCSPAAMQLLRPVANAGAAIASLIASALAAILAAFG